jgi:hypothetical protein
MTEHKHLFVCKICGAVAEGTCARLDALHICDMTERMERCSLWANLFEISQEGFLPESAEMSLERTIVTVKREILLHFANDQRAVRLREFFGARGPSPLAEQRIAWLHNLYRLADGLVEVLYGNVAEALFFTCELRGIGHDWQFVVEPDKPQVCVYGCCGPDMGLHARYVDRLQRGDCVCYAPTNLQETSKVMGDLLALLQLRAEQLEVTNVP